MTRPILAALPLAVVLLLTGCVNATTTTDDIPSSTATSSPSPTDGDEAAPVLPEDDATVLPVPEAAETSQADAITAAETAVAAFGQPELPYQRWIAGLYPYLSQTGAAAYEGTDPANVPVHQVTGTGVILEEPTEVALIVQVPTDAGLYSVSLSRSTPTAPWLADRIRPAGA